MAFEYLNLYHILFYRDTQHSHTPSFSKVLLEIYLNITRQQMWCNFFFCKVRAGPATFRPFQQGQIKMFDHSTLLYRFLQIVDDSCKNRVASPPVIVMIKR